MKKIIKKIALAVATLALTSTVLVGSISAYATDDFTVAAKAAIAVDAKTGKIFYEQNSSEVLGIASLTKMITLYLVMDAIKDGKLAWDTPVEIDDYSYALSQNMELSNVPLQQETSYTVKQLFDAALIASANACATALAVKIAGSEPAFVDMMKAKLESWGIKDAKVVNVTGLNNEALGENIYPGSAPTDENMMSAKDVAIVARHLINDYPDVLQVASTPSETFEDPYSSIEMTNWDWMLPGMDFYKEGVDGLKTGTTDLAGACFTGTIVRDNWRIITVVLDATDHENNAGARFVETGSLMDYVYDNWSQQELYKKSATLPEAKSMKVVDGKQESVPLVLADPVNVWVRSDMDAKNVSVEFSADKGKQRDGALVAPIKKDQLAGEATIQLKEDTLGYLDGTQNTHQVVTSKAVEKANFFILTGRRIQDFFKNLF